MFLHKQKSNSSFYSLVLKVEIDNILSPAFPSDIIVGPWSQRQQKQFSEVFLSPMFPMKLYTCGMFQSHVFGAVLTTFLIPGCPCRNLF